MENDDLDFLDEFIDNAFEQIENIDNGSKTINDTLEPNKVKKLKDFDFLADKEKENSQESSSDKPKGKSLLAKKVNWTPESVDDRKKNSVEKSLVHNGDTDDSEDEDNRNPSERKYNEFGQFINSKLKEEDTNKSFSDLFSKNKSWKSKLLANNDLSKSPSCVKSPGDSFVSTIGLNIANPLISPGLLFEKMAGRSYIHFIKLKYHAERLARKDSEILNKDWILIGVVVSKSAPKESKKGNSFCVWKMSDLKMGLKTASLFLFGNAYTQLWKRPVGTAIGILNPTVMDSRKDDGDEACLSVYSADQVMVIGQSKDFALCKARKKNGDRCTMFVNKSSCDVCIYHVEKEYKKYTNKRSDLQSPSGGLQNLRNKVLGKNEVFYAGQSYSAIKSTQSKKTVEKDKNRLRDLFAGSGKLSFPDEVKPQAKDSAPNIDFTRFKRIKDADILSRLSANKAEAKSAGDYAMKNAQTNSTTDKPQRGLNFSISKSPKKNKENGMSVEKTTHKARKQSLNKSSHEIKQTTLETNNVCHFPKSRLENGKCAELGNGNVDDERPEGAAGCTEFSREALSEFFGKKKLSLDKLSNNRRSNKNLNVKQTIKSELPKSNKLSSSPPLMVDLSMPVTRKDREIAKRTALNYVKNRGPIKKVNPNEVRNKDAPAKKRSLPDEKEDSTSTNQTEASLPSRFIELMNKTSKHLDLVEKADEEAFDNYFEKMNKKEEMEEKMLSTYKLPCKAVRCLTCKYTWFSASDLCKSERHRIKVVDAVKRFFRCSNCSHRTVSLEIIPLIACQNCGSSNWLRAAMMSEKRTMVNLNQLSIRGGEQTFMNSVESNGNLNLLVPD